MVERHGGILKVGTLAKDQFPHARVRVEVRNEIQSFTLDNTLSVVREGADCLIWNRRGEPNDTKTVSFY